MKTHDILSRELDLGKSRYYHEIFVKGFDFESAKKRVLIFFERYQLVRYSNIHILESSAISATDRNFHERLQAAISKNRQIIYELSEEIKSENISTLDDIIALPQGYKTKMLHVITHFMDGFFGIDTYFYNLEEDSHWVSEKMLEKIKNNPSNYWILSIEAEI